MENEVMDIEDLDISAGSLRYTEQSLIDEIKIESPSRANFVRSRGGDRSKKVSTTSLEERDSNSNFGDNVDSETNAQIPIRNSQIRKDALDWAANFQPPTSPGDIKVSSRKPAGARSKRQYPLKESGEVKSNRLRTHYNPQYRELLNCDINNAAARSIPMDDPLLVQSQIGSSTWTSLEKDSFFTALSRSGRDNVRAIASRIGTKSDLEVQEYMQLLQKSLVEKKTQGKLFGLVAVPAAFDISEECCELLEKAGDALASRQQHFEAEIERAKWGESWLLTTDVSYWVDKRRKQEGGEEAINEVLPAASLLNLSNWLELSERIFMNPTGPHEDDNWHSLAEEGETPAIRATAFEDFHSLAVHVTKKLVSTTLFCTMSRERAMNAQKIKHAEVNPGDVEAAVNILKMKNTTHEFWIKAARRCNLQVIDGDTDEENYLAYGEVEGALASFSFPHRLRSRSASRNPHTRRSTQDPQTPNQTVESSDEFKSADESPRDYSSNPEDAMPISISDDELGSISRPSTPAKLATDQAAYSRALEQYTEAFDMEASRVEELRLWLLLKKDPPFDIQPEPLEEPVKPKYLNREWDDGEDWRDFVGFRSEWEGMENQVLEEAFERNRMLKRKRSRMDVGRERMGASGGLSSELVDEEDLTSLDGEENGGDLDGDSAGLGNIEQSEEAQGPEGGFDGVAQIPEVGVGSAVRISSWSSDGEQSPYHDETLVAHFQSLAGEFRVSDDEMSIKDE